LFRADRIGHQLFGLRQVTVGRFAVIQAGGCEQVRAERVPADRGDRPRVRAAALAVSRRGESVPVTRVVVSQGLQWGATEWFMAAIYHQPR